MIDQKAYSVYNPTVGYCGGMMSIAAILLMHMPEEEVHHHTGHHTAHTAHTTDDGGGGGGLQAFWVFVRLTLDRNLEPLYVRSLLGLKQCLHVLDRLLAVFLPDLARHLVRGHRRYHHHYHRCLVLTEARVRLALWHLSNRVQRRSTPTCLPRGGSSRCSPTAYLFPRSSAFSTPSLSTYVPRS